MKVIVNGDPGNLAEGATVADVVVQFDGGTGAGVAVAVNDTVISKSEWSTTRLDEGDRVEVLRAIGGGC